jgi:hypothetical protein
MIGSQSQEHVSIVLTLDLEAMILRRFEQPSLCAQGTTP